jgi:hypothetical protein
MPYKYLGEPSEMKRFVVVCHEAAHAICLKATSKVALYVSDPRMMGGVVFYRAGDLSFFELDTAIQPDNPHPIPHADILHCLQSNTLEILGNMPAGFKAQLAAAIGASITMKPARKKNLLERLHGLG